MVAPVDADLAVVGAGCAGLSLALALATARWPGRRPRIAVIEPRERYVRDRTWCFWPVEPQPFTAAITHRWSRWEVRVPGRSIIRGSSRLPYVHVAADAFYTQALSRLREAGVELHLGRAASSIVDEGSRVTITTDGGAMRARLAFDSRPPHPGPSAAPATGDIEVELLQHFLGWEIVVDRPRFDPGKAILMDFDVPQGDGLHFLYVLPFSRERALVEATYFTEATLPTATYEARIRDYLRRRFAVDDFTIAFRERGVIPMTTAPARPQPSPRVYNVGLRGGLAKPSTGYAFLAIQRFAQATADRLAGADLTATPPPPPAPRSALATAMDRVFLSYVHRHPERAPKLFADLFDRLPPDLLIRFLSDHASARECLRVMTSTPLAAMTREVLRSRARWLRPAST
ncbi:MAG: hypothetical protein KC486_09605 [Myxococcales bacterium]|nr:hypothetical protein [Myxococcales bacterium]